MSTKNFFKPVDNTKTFSQMEESILPFWKEYDIFRRSIESRFESNKYVFFDGPPFATGTPHYGHILQGTTKDAIPRYQTMKGRRVERNFGWDCHGVPLEFQVEKEFGIGGKPGIEAMGVGKFNDLCQSIVMRCRDQWEHTVKRMGRFVDFEQDYRTMDPDFMESVWWVFGQLWDKGLIYEGEKVVSYSPKLGSPLSNFEATLNYKDIDDPTVTVKIKLKAPKNQSSKEPEYILFWTTTPWTMPCMSAITLGGKLEYSKVKHKDEIFIVATNLLEKNFGEDYEVLSTMMGTELVGREFEPLFDYFDDGKRTFTIIEDDYVTDEDGTGLVPTSALGEEDFQTMQRFGIEAIDPPFDENGYYDQTIPELAGMYFRSDPEVEGSKEKNANDFLIEKTKAQGQLFRREQYRHRYPHCWRTDCCLMERPIKTWFINVQKIKSRLIELNENINWTPNHLKHGRFGKILETAPDWAISRNRYWGTPMPVWRCDKTGEVQVIRSRKELEALSGTKVEDLHKQYVDDLTWKNPKTGGTMRKIPEVFDCWVESGSMPFASIHYPFDKERRDFQVADFIGEAVDQTRCWFYVMHVLGTALLDTNVYKNVVCSGIVLAEDGQKMSKSKKNYPDPQLIFDKYGADAMRFYLLKSPVATKGENLRFAEREVEEVLKNVLLPIQSAYNFFSTYANIDEWSPTRLVYLRHGQAEHNEKRMYSGNVENPHALTAEGQTQAETVAHQLPTPDVIYSSDFVRTLETAEIVRMQINFEGQLLTDTRIRETFFGDLDGSPLIGRTGRLGNKSVETVSSLFDRAKNMFEAVTQKHRGQTILLVSHGDSIVAAKMAELGVTDEKHFSEFATVLPGQYNLCFAPPNPTHELDLWILSELQTLVGDYTDSFDSYDFEKGLRGIPDFIDKLNNWYLRRSRERFWAKGLTEEKISGYETLHHVLLTFAKLLAPVCPFYAERLYQDVTGDPHASVHLEMMPLMRTAWVDKKLAHKTEIMREVVKLSAGIRARAKIKLRQPLGKLQFALASKEDQSLLESQDLEILKKEANVQHVEILDSVEGLAQKILKV
ncbi:MAG TPA: isoleucine--tRNA ligase, partial [Candidatus Gracilibacteria bacterium]